MRTFPIIIIVATLSAMVILGGCAKHRIEKEFEFDQEITQVVANVDSGGLHLTSGPASPTAQSKVDLELTYRGSDEPKYRVTVVESTLYIDLECDRLFSCGGQFDVVVPAKASADLETGSGGIEVRNMRGAMQLKTGSGGIDVQNVENGVDARTGSGGIDVSRVTGEVKAITGSGGIQLNQVGGNIDLDTGSGSIKGHHLGGLEVHAETGSGSIDVDFDIAPQMANLSTGSGSIGIAVPSGTYHVDAETHSGAVDIEGITNDAAADHIIVARTGSGSISITGF